MHFQYASNSVLVKDTPKATKANHVVHMGHVKNICFGILVQWNKNLGWWKVQKKNELFSWNFPWEGGGVPPIRQNNYFFEKNIVVGKKTLKTV